MKRNDKLSLTVVTLVALVFLIDECKAAEQVKTIICSNKYKFTSLPNRFGDTTQDEAIVNMHTFFPLTNTFCSDHLASFVCAVFLPPAFTLEDTNAQPPCRSLCEEVRDNCTYAMDQLQFMWPEQITCDKFIRGDCFDSRTSSGKSVSPTANCSATITNPICSKVIDVISNGSYFAQVNQPFTNYFKHTSQHQAVFEFSKHGMLVNLLVELKKLDSSTTTRCLQKFVYLLCTLYVPRCGEKKTEEYGITRNECNRTLGSYCSPVIGNLRALGYDINWPPVTINCSVFPNERNVSHSFQTITLQGLLPPPPTVKLAEIGPDLSRINWQVFPRVFEVDSVKTGLLYKATGLKAPYIHKDYNKLVTGVQLENLNPGTSYDVFVGTVEQGNVLVPGAFFQLQIKTEIVDRVSTPFCDKYYNFTTFPNAFGDKSQTDAMFHMHTFFPLFDTMCSQYLQAFMCSAFLPPYDYMTKGPQKQCGDFCHDVFDSCRYAMTRLKFKWPEELKCGKRSTQGVPSCFSHPKNKSPETLKSGGCSATKEQSICSLVTSSRPSESYFSAVKTDFTNYFNHTTQDQAVYELSKHVTLLSLLDAVRIKPVFPTDPIAATDCIHNLTFLLCSLHFPRCNKSDVQYLVTKPECEAALNARGQCASLIQQTQILGYSVQWPPVQVNCNMFPQNQISRDYDFKQITFGDTIPPPSDLRYNIRNSTATTWSWKISSIFGDTENGVEFLYKPADIETTYNHKHGPNRTQEELIINGFSPNKTYDVFVATLDRKKKIPGRFRRIDYIHGTTVVDIPPQLDLCFNSYRKTLLPNLFGDPTPEKARLRMLKFFPLVYTLCSENLTRFLCSVFLPRFDVNTRRQRPCKSACKEIHQSCFYAINRLGFYWPPEMECDKFDDDESCDGLNQVQVQTFQPTILSRPSKRSLVQCKPTPPNRICAAVSRKVGLYPVFNVTSDFANDFTNYFNHTSIDEAIYELSQHLALLSSIQKTSCLDDLTMFLCHLHLPACPLDAKMVSRDLCLNIMNISLESSKCRDPANALLGKKAYFTWPPVMNVDCYDTKWFSNVNTTLTNMYNFAYNLPQPPPKNVGIGSRSSSSLTVSYTVKTEVQVLYRENGTTQPYELGQQLREINFLTLLRPGEDYEMKIATIFPPSGFPGPFITLVDNTYGLCQADITGENITKGSFYWETTDPFTIDTILCPYNDRLPPNNARNNDSQSDVSLISKTSEARRYCNCSGDVACKNPKWNEPNTGVCNYKSFNDSITQQLSDLLKSLRTGESTAVNVSEKVVDLTANTTGFQEEDVDLTLLILEELVKNARQGKLNETGPNIVKTVDNILNVNSDVLANGQKNTRSSTRFLQVLDNYLENAPVQNDGKVTQQGKNLAVHAQEFRAKNFEGALASSFMEGQEQERFEVYDNEAAVRPLTSRVSLTIPKSLFVALNIQSKDQKQRLHFAVFRKTPFFQSLRQNRSLSADATTVRKKNSFVIAGSVKGQKIRNLTQPVETSYDPLEKAIEESTACVFWDFGLRNDLGDWSSDGCSYTGTTNGLVNCRCDHLTNFAMLMDVYIDDHNAEAHEKALSIISYIGCAVSLLGLFLTIIIILILKELRSKVPTQILLNFCIALSLTLVVFLAAAERSKTSSMASCRVAAVALHYFVLATFMWMAIEAFNMYLAFVKVMPTHVSRFMLKCILAGWGLPAIVVIITAALAIEEYGDDHFCRLRGLPFFIAFLTPVLIILVGNSVAFVLIFHSILTSGSKVTADRKVDGLVQARRGAAILVVLGVTWLFGILAISDAKLAFQYLFCIFNAFQGLLVFLFYCVLSADTRAKLGKLLCGKGDGKDSVSGQKRHPGGTNLRFEDTTSKNTRNDVHTGSTGMYFATPNYNGSSIEFETMKSNQTKDSLP